MGVSLDLSGRRKDGTTFPVDISLSPIESDGEFEVMAAVRDISEQEAIRTKYRRILEAVPDAVVVADAATGEIVDANERVTDVIGVDPDDLVGQKQTELHPSEEEEAYRELFEEHVATRDSIFAQFPDGSNIYVETTDGERVPVEINANVFQLGDRRLIAGVFRDITIRKEHERQLKTLHQKTRELMQTNEREEVAHLVADAANEVLGYASNVVRLVSDGGYLRPVATTDRARTEMGRRPDYRLGTDTPVSQAFERGEPLCYADVRTLEDGYDRGEARSAMYLPMGDHGVVSIVDDSAGEFDQLDVEFGSILTANAETALDRLEREHQLEQQNERLDEFANVVSHDLRSPLNVAQGWLDTIRADDGSEQINRVSDALDRMNDIIDDTLLLARQGQTVGETELVDMSALSSTCWEMVSTEDGDLEIADDFTLRGDRDRLQHVLENAFRNAVEHGGENTTITIGTLEQDGFYIEDDGPGIPEGEHETVFEPGYTSTAEGTGLGLTIVRRIAEGHGWEVRTLNGDTGGARFEFTNVDIERK
jgi:PAS domain S-box-containing protein